jgi:hypothetical protein
LTAPGAASAWRWTAPASPSKTATAAKGVYFVRYVAPNPDKKEPGFFGKLFGGATATPAGQVPDRGAQRNSTTVPVLTSGAPGLERRQRIVKVLADDRSARARPRIGKGQARSACPLSASFSHAIQPGQRQRGNATVVEAGLGTQCRRLLVDCGLGLRELAARLAQAGLAPRPDASSSPTNTGPRGLRPELSAASAAGVDERAPGWPWASPIWASGCAWRATWRRSTSAA